MSKKRKLFVSLLTVLIFAFLSVQTTFAYSNVTLKSGTTSDTVSQLQKDLKALGFMDVSPTGYLGDITKSAVIAFQKKYGLSADGIAGAQTLGKLDKLLNRSAALSRGETEGLEQKIVTYAKKLLGFRYVWGGMSPKGFDCSGFVKYVFDHFGIILNRVSADQAKQGTAVKKADLRVGDLVFFDTDGGHNEINHVGIYIGGGKFIQASSASGSSGVVISDITEGFYANSYMSARRVIK